MPDINKMEWNESAKKEKNILWKCEEKEGEGVNSYRNAHKFRQHRSKENKKI